MCYDLAAWCCEWVLASRLTAAGVLPPRAVPYCRPVFSSDALPVKLWTPNPRTTTVRLTAPGVPPPRAVPPVAVLVSGAAPPAALLRAAAASSAGTRGAAATLLLQRVQPQSGGGGTLVAAGPAALTVTQVRSAARPAPSTCPSSALCPTEAHTRHTLGT